MLVMAGSGSKNRKKWKQEKWLVSVTANVWQKSILNLSFVKLSFPLCLIFNMNLLKIQKCIFLNSHLISIPSDFFSLFLWVWGCVCNSVATPGLCTSFSPTLNECIIKCDYFSFTLTDMRQFNMVINNEVAGIKIRPSIHTQTHKRQHTSQHKQIYLPFEDL